ncbi:MAG TPA: hypothetical protein VMT63_14285 [Bacteroidales bacterium]|nr:hypothetical protein [Bacteroidales bacterium]
MKKYHHTDFSDKRTLEKFSSAFTLSDMEIFIFPELFYPLVLANIMSPVIWEWRDDPWFHNIEKKSFTYKANRIKQFIIQNFVFNLDLSTWGLTTKTQEVERFSDYIDIEMLRQSNALFGYEGDKYYFDIDIRKHFGLDKYDSDIIPYWKTETVEAMTAFRHKENFTTGGGECVSLSSLYAATMFVVGRVPLEKIFLIATPLHSQNFVIEKEGLITNNRRIVTKNMWFNGTSLSAKARRALENEKVTIVSHISGYIHTIYNEATIDQSSYNMFCERLKDFLVTSLNTHIFINFLRFKSRFKNHFQFRCECSGKYRYILLEKMFEYEHNSKYNVSAEMRGQLIQEIEGDEFHLSPIQGKIMLNELEDILDRNPGMGLEELERKFVAASGSEHAMLIGEMFSEIRDFVITIPRLPEGQRNFVHADYPEITVDDTREQITGKIAHMAQTSELCNLTLYAYRQMDVIDWHPFIKAAIERNPVCYTELSDKTPEEVYKLLLLLENYSIYDSKRLSLPDEVWNFRRGDGLEKAVLMADYLLLKYPGEKVSLNAAGTTVTLEFRDHSYEFRSEKGLRKRMEISKGSYKIS